MTAPRFQPLIGDRTGEPARQPHSNLDPRGTASARLAQAFNQSFDDEDVTFEEFGGGRLGQLRSGGVDNPYGRGLSAYEPNSVLFDGYANAYGAVQQSKADEAAAKAGGDETVTVDFTDFSGGGIVQADGQVQTMISAAMDLAARNVPYVWGGTSRNGVDCSGLIYYAARAAGIPGPNGGEWPRYVASQYGQMGSAVTLDQARPGDIIYYDEPGVTDHVGIYIGNGQMIQAPQTGDHVRISGVGHPTSIRRIFNDGAYSTMATPSGGVQPGYFGQPVNNAASAQAIARSALGVLAGGQAPRTVTSTSGPMRMEF